MNQVFRSAGLKFLVLGALNCLALPPFFIWQILFLTMPTLLLLLEKNDIKSFSSGLCYGFGYFATSMYWVSIALFVDIEAYFWVLPLSLIILPLILSLYYGLAFWCYCILQRRFSSKFVRLLIFTYLWLVFEYIRGHLFTGLPWNLIGYVWANDKYLIQIADIIGIYGVSCLVIFITGALYLWRSTFIAAPILVLILCFYYGYHKISNPLKTTNHVNLRLVQGNVEQYFKWSNNQRYVNIAQHSSLSKQPTSLKLDYIIWPETAITSDLTEEILHYVAKIIPQDGFLITGGLRYKNKYQPDQEIWNSLFVINDQGKIDSYYDKMHLLPFGEYLPFRKTLHFPDFGFSDYSAGNTPKIIHGFHSNICYESIFSDQALDASLNFNWILTITNDGWYGDSIGPHQHFHMSRVRAVELGKPLVRVANTGISGVINYDGAILKSSKLCTASVIDHSLQLYQPRQTFYSKYQDWIVRVFITVGALILWQSLKKSTPH